VRWTLLDAQQRRVAFLADMVDRLDLRARVEVVRERAEIFGRRTDRRERYSAVVARGFGSPSATAEMAAPSLRLGGAVLVSEPPGSTGERWPDGPLRQLGLVCRRIHGGVPAVVELRRERPCPSWAPRRVGMPAKRPLF
jgi:16S rRNA (guanine527-N7)-methyltransferase